ncbi:MAG TPA: cation:dicarboxylase symporter family transporter, partial [Armatimonadota bacterium]|nr:cation:dicarboxylase symporter family transporter [Armatimonadota bacterium]
MASEISSARRRAGIPLYARVLIGVVLGVLLGRLMGTGTLLGVRAEDLGQLGMLVIRLLKALAVPLILFAILDAFLRTRISARRGGKMILICLANVSVAFLIGLTLMNTLHPGRAWRGHLEQMAGELKRPAVSATAPTSATAPASPTAPPSVPKPEAEKPTLNPLKNFAAYIPESLVDPFTGKANVISVVLLALMGGAALRRVKDRQQREGEEGYRAVERFVETVLQALVVMLEWVVQAVPFAVFGVVAQVVGRSGPEVFLVLGSFLGVILLGLGIHSLLYYPAVAWLVGKKPPRVYLGRGADAILTGLSTNSSLATVPITLRCLTEKMGVSQQSARLSACIGTN